MDTQNILYFKEILHLTSMMIIWQNVRDLTEIYVFSSNGYSIGVCNETQWKVCINKLAITAFIRINIQGAV